MLAIAIATAIAPVAQAAPNLVVLGSCPGVVDLEISGATPGGTVAILSADDQGTAPFPGGPCGGNTGLSSGGLALRKVVTADGAGDATVSPDLPAGVCGSWVQVVDLSTCQLSAARELRGPACSPGGIALVDEINRVRGDNGLPAIPLSPSMCEVGQAHSDDQAVYYPGMPAECNLHSWSSYGPWSGCCYTADHAQAQCMWDKPRELTDYTSTGFEISAWGYATVEAAVQGWLGSPGHADVILNRGIWASYDWRAVGAGQTGTYYNVWFGTADDPAL